MTVRQSQASQANLGWDESRAKQILKHSEASSSSIQIYLYTHREKEGGKVRAHPLASP